MEMARHSPRSAMRRSSKNLRVEDEGSPPRGNGTPAPSTVARTSASVKSLQSTLSVLAYQLQIGSFTVSEPSHTETFSLKILEVMSTNDL